MSAALLDVENLDVHFGGLRAVDGISFHIGSNEILALIGPNGAGKTTTFNAISGGIVPSAGTVRFRGGNTTGFAPTQMARLGMARTFQNVRLFGELSTRDNLMIGSYVRSNCGVLAAALRLPRHTAAEAQARVRADEWLEYLNLKRYADRSAGLLPLGLQRLAELGRALAADPALVLLDEPAAGLNPAEKENLARILRRTVERTGTSMMLIDHDMKLVMGVADRVVVLDFGRKIAEGTPRQVSTDRAVIDAYMGV